MIIESAEGVNLDSRMFYVRVCMSATGSKIVRNANKVTANDLNIPPSLI
jgi:hypothetical protein